jgi:O-antigen/teichoic acid export membrane protein
MAGLSLALVPWYLHQLGSDHWGVVALSISLQAVMSLVDSGLGQVMPRDVARVAGEPTAVARTFRTFSTAYVLLACGGFCVGQALVWPVVEFWIDPGSGSHIETGLALRIALIQFVFQFSNNAHSGYWNGLERQSEASIRQCFFVTAKHASAVLAIYFWQPTVLAYLVPFAAISAIEYFVNRYSILSGLSHLGRRWARWEELTKLRGEVGVLATGVLLGMLLTQTDRIVLSGLVDIASFGRYAIVANLALAFMQLQIPVARAFLPRMVQAEQRGDTGVMTQMAVVIVSVCVVPCLVAGLFAPILLDVWVRDAVVVQQGSLPFRFILAAVALNAIYLISYERLLVRGESALILRINILIAMLVVPSAPFIVIHSGILGGGIIWLLISSLQVLIGYALARRAVRR